jgi:hypothetical protein
MKAGVLLRTASLVALFQFIAHTSLLMTYVPKHGPEEVALVAAMKSHVFSFSGAHHSYWEMYFGYGLFAAFNCLVEALLFWQLARFAKNSPSLIRPLAALFCFANVGYAVLVLKYFFVVPLVPDVIIAICLGLVLIAARPRSSATGVTANA